MSGTNFMHPTTGPGHPDANPSDEEMVLTPGGWRPASVVHRVEQGHHVSGKDGRLQKIRTATGAVVADLGLVKTAGLLEANLPRNVSVPAEKKAFAFRGGAPVTFGEGWIVYTGWLNTTGQPINSFITEWVVPPPISAANSQCR